MIDYIEGFINFWAHMTPGRFFRFFWFFFIFDFMRYLFFDLLIVLILDNIRNAFNKRARRRAAKALREDNPLVSVIAPGKNEGKHIPALARSLRAQTYRRLELIVVDDGSDDDTSRICAGALRRGEIQGFFRNDIRGGKASAANLALRYCRGRYVVHLDADSELADDAIEKILIPFYMDPRIGAVGGNITIRNSDESLAAALQFIEYAKSISIGRRASAFLGIMRIISGAFGAFRKDLLDRIGGWDVGPGLDGDITLKHRKMGYKVAFEPDSICLTNCPVTFKKLAKQRYRWDRSLVRFRVRKHRDLLLPQANFNTRNFLASLDNIFFNFVLNLNWWIYLIDMLLNFPGLAHYLIPMNYVLFVLSSIIQLSVYIAMTRNAEIRDTAFRHFIYMPLVPIYTGIYLRLVRTYAYMMEFIYRKSYEDAWNPWKVSKVAKEKGL